MIYVDLVKDVALILIATFALMTDDTDLVSRIGLSLTAISML